MVEIKRSAPNLKDLGDSERAAKELIAYAKSKGWKYIGWRFQDVVDVLGELACRLIFLNKRGKIFKLDRYDEWQKKLMSL